jgi:hypothetical protein
MEARDAKASGLPLLAHLIQAGRSLTGAGSKGAIGGREQFEISFLHRSAQSVDCAILVVVPEGAMKFSRRRLTGMTEQDRVLAKYAWRLVPFMALLYVVNYIDRVKSASPLSP